MEISATQLSTFVCFPANSKVRSDIQRHANAGCGCLFDSIRFDPTRSDSNCKTHFKFPSAGRFSWVANFALSLVVDDVCLSHHHHHHHLLLKRLAACVGPVASGSVQFGRPTNWSKMVRAQSLGFQTSPLSLSLYLLKLAGFFERSDSFDPQPSFGNLPQCCTKEASFATSGSGQRSRNKPGKVCCARSLTYASRRSLSASLGNGRFLWWKCYRQRLLAG